MYQRWHKHGESYLSENRCPPSVLEEDITGNSMESMIMYVVILILIGIDLVMRNHQMQKLKHSLIC
jgi:hypothetical protein